MSRVRHAFISGVAADCNSSEPRTDDRFPLHAVDVPFRADGSLLIWRDRARVLPLDDLPTGGVLELLGSVLICAVQISCTTSDVTAGYELLQ